jgi:cyclic pyranopterin phosphate synthase
VYCRPERIAPLPQVMLLTAGEIGRLARVLSSLGIDKIRVTGGEPLLRPDLETILAEIRQAGQITDLSLTTNGQGLADRAAALQRAGLMRVNLSLDSLKPERYRQISGGELTPVLHAIDVCLAIGLLPLKINVVLIRGINDDEIGDLISLTRERPLAVRFIELMPMNRLGLNPRHRISGDEILAAAPELKQLPRTDPAQPAEDYQMPGYVGTVGLIRPLTHRFCADCNRIRITSDGQVKPCLGAGRELSLLDILRQPQGGSQNDEETQLAGLIRQAIWHKPSGHAFDAAFCPARGMDRTGG